MNQPLHISLGLSDEEYEAVIEKMGREPNHLELAMYSVMWSEHCSYKSSRIHLGRLPSKGEHVIMGPGENAGVIDAGEGFAIAIRMESHNHPSAIEPYQGAATGVGGILRDIFTVGARPVALLDSLWMGPRSDARSAWVFKGVVSGISGYGNAVGVPNAGGEIDFSRCYRSNPLVNVAAVGVAPIDRLIRATASGVGNLVVLLGSSTGRDGIGGVSVLASAGFSGEISDDDSSKRPSVQVGDPFEEKKLIEACLELLEKKLIVGIQDLGGAGLACATSETAANGRVGMDVFVDLVPRRELAMEPFEVMTSESQERMLAIVEPLNSAEVLSLCSKWEVQATVIGRVTAPRQDGGEPPIGMLRIFDGEGGNLLADVPAASLADEAPLYDRPRCEPSDLAELRSKDPALGLDLRDGKAWLAEMWKNPEPIFSQYDHQLFLNTIVAPGSDATLLRVGAPGVGQSNVAMALSSDGNPRWCEVDPYLGALATVAESALNVAMLGGEPKALVDCLNFGNPEHPEVMWQLSAAIDGISEACKRLEIPVVGGNVSLYNESDGRDIFPTPVVTTLGLRPMPSIVPPTLSARAGDTLVHLGRMADTIAGSYLAVEILERPWGRLFEVDLELLRTLIELAVTCSRESTELGVSALHNVSNGGLALALVELAYASGSGLVVKDGGKVSLAALFGEDPSQFIVATNTPERVLALADSKGVQATLIGEMTGEDLVISELLSYSALELKEAFRSGLFG